MADLVRQHAVTEVFCHDSARLGVPQSTERGMEELSLYSLEAIDELIAQGSVYRGEEWQQCIRRYIALKRIWQTLRSDEARTLFTWEQAAKLSSAWCRMLNTAMGTLVADVSNGMGLDAALRRYETITELGYLESPPRHHATIRDIDPAAASAWSSDAA